eukprot:1731459-Amphidinium_carterae.1
MLRFHVQSLSPFLVVQSVLFEFHTPYKEVLSDAATSMGPEGTRLGGLSASSRLLAVHAREKDCQ